MIRVVDNLRMLKERYTSGSLNHLHTAEMNCIGHFAHDQARNEAAALYISTTHIAF